MPSPRFGFQIIDKALSLSGWIASLKHDFGVLETAAALATDLAAHAAANPIAHPDASIGTAKLIDANVTDPKIGTRTIVETAPASDVLQLGAALNALAYMLQQATGTADWKTLPATTLATAFAHYTLSGAHETFYGNGSPEGAVVANIGALYRNRTPVNASDVLWVKYQNATNTGWRKAGMFPVVTRGLITIPYNADSAQAVISAVVMAQAELRFLGASGSFNATENNVISQTAVRLELLDATHIRAQREGTANNADEQLDVSWELTHWT